MSLFEEELPRKKTAIVPGEDLGRHSITELEERIVALKQEIGRVEEAITSKRASADLADSFFKRS